MRILLTGAGGFTGRQFVQSASKNGHETVAMQSDLTQAEAVMEEVGALEVDAVVHLAAISFVGHAQDSAFYDVNLFGTLNLLNAVKATGRSLKKFLLASSANVYGNCEQSPIRETQAPSPVNHYAMSKLAMECMCHARSAGVPLLVARPFNYTGPGQASQFVIPKLVDHFRRAAASVTLGNLHVEREYNDVRFVCEAYLRLLEVDSAEHTFNVCTGRTYNLHDVMTLLQRMTGNRPEVQVDPLLVRDNEVHRLCGDPARLHSAIGSLPCFTLEDTLSWMLATPA